MYCTFKKKQPHLQAKHLLKSIPRFLWIIFRKQHASHTRVTIRFQDRIISKYFNRIEENMAHASSHPHPWVTKHESSPGWKKNIIEAFSEVKASRKGTRREERCRKVALEIWNLQPLSRWAKKKKISSWTRLWKNCMFEIIICYYLKCFLFKNILK